LRSERQRDVLAAAVVAVVSFLPFLRGALAGTSFYFRDLAAQFLPLRRFALDGLRAGAVRLSNPLVHEGVALSPPAAAYPLDLLQLLRPDEVGISLVLALHIPLAAVAFFAMARSFSLPRLAAGGAAVAYALGGFLLSTVNLYVYVQAAAWAPVLVASLVRLGAGGGRRAAALVAAAVALCLSTTGAEIVLQAVLLGLVLGWPARGVRVRRLSASAAALALGAAIAAPVIVLVVGQVEGSARDRGFATDVVLAHSIHPITFAQTVVGGLYGNLGNLANEWWGQNFFPRGFPYVLSLYLGAPLLSLAAVGMGGERPGRRRLLLLAAGGILLSLGRWAGFAPLVDALPLLHVFRYPVKAFFLVHFTACLLAGFGLEALTGDKGPSAWRRLAASSFLLGALLVGTLFLPALAPRLVAAFAAGFFHPGTDGPTRWLQLGRVLLDAATGGTVALAVAALAVAAWRGALVPRRAALLVAALVAADLLRTGAGLNPMVGASFFHPSPDLAVRLPALREGRVFTCGLETSASYKAARRARGADHELWTFAAMLETLTPNFNVPLGVPTALSIDLTMLVPEERVLSPREASCADVDAILPRLRRAGVLTVLSVDPLDHPALEARDVIRPERIAPLAVHVYRLRDALPATERPPRLPTPRRLAAAGTLSALALLGAGILAGGRFRGRGRGARTDDSPPL
jgi:hypothetical protein